MKISEWFRRSVNSHCIYDDAFLKAEFLKQCGDGGDWPTHDVNEVNSSVGVYKCSEDPISEDSNKKLAFGWEVAAALEESFCGTFTHGLYYGRGSKYRASIKALEAAGK